MSLLQSITLSGLPACATKSLRAHLEPVGHLPGPFIEGSFRNLHVQLLGQILLLEPMANCLQIPVAVVEEFHNRRDRFRQGHAIRAVTGQGAEIGHDDAGYFGKF